MKECNTVKQSPIAGLAAYGGGAGSVIFGRKGVGGYEIERSLRFNSGDQAYLNRTPSTSGNRRTFTFACWIKRSKLVNCGSSGQEIFRAGDSALSAMNFAPSDGPCDALSFKADQGGVSPGSATNAVFRDFSAWFHVVYRIDTTQSTASNRVRLYVNGVEQTWHTTNYPSQNQELKFNQSGQPHYIGGKEYLDGYLADIHFIDGQSLGPSSFGRTNADGIWDPKEFTGSFGTNGFHLKLDDASSDAALGTDSSGNNNTYTVNNISAAGTSSPTATVVGDPTSSTDNPFGVGQGYSVDFDGNDEIRFTGPGTVTGDLTVECFYKMTSGSGFNRIFSTKEDTYSSEQTIIRRHDNGNLQFYFGNGTPEQQGSSISTNTWYHAAIVYDRSASTVSYYLDGSRVGTDSYSSDVPITLMVAAGGYGSENFNGKVSNARITKQALYSGSSYTVPTSTLTTTSQGATASNVTLLCCHQSSTTAVEGTIGSPRDKDSLFDSPVDGTQSDTGAGGEVSGNYATWNALGPGGTSTYATLSNGNLKASCPASGKSVFQTIFPQSGKWYVEINFVSGGGAGGGLRMGLINENNINQDLGSTANSWAYLADGRTYHNGSAPSYGVSSAPGDLLMMCLDIDAGKLWYGKNGTWMASGDPANGSNPSQTFTAGQKMSFSVQSGSGTVQVVEANWGQRAWSYTAPSGFKAICTTNLPTPAIANGSAYFDVSLWTGDGNTGRNITGLSFSPDLTWIKSRSLAKAHALFDAVRGANKRLQSNSTNAETTHTDQLSAFISNGFTVEDNNTVNQNGATYAGWSWDAGANSNKTYAVKVVSDSGNKYRFDDFGTSAVTLDLEEGSTYVFDQSDSSNSGHPLRFSTTANGTHGGGTEYTTGVTVTGTPGQAGAKTTIVVAASAPTLFYYCSVHSGMGGQANTNSTAGATNLDGNVQATVRANATAGFSIISVPSIDSTNTIRTAGHGLNAAPHFIISKNRDFSDHWFCYHKDVQTNNRQQLRLNTTDGTITSGSDLWAHTSSVMGFNGALYVASGNTNNLIFYCFTPIEGYSAFGSYTGNGQSDGLFVHTQFRPRFVIIKNTNLSTQNWYILDSERDSYNLTANKLEPNTTNTENASPNTATTNALDFLSNGFKCRTSNDGTNQNNASYVYAAFAEHPFKTARAR